MRIIILILFLCCVSVSAQAARGFGSTLGVGSTDVVLSGYTTGLSTTISISTWLWINGNGGGGLGRVCDQQNTSGLQISTSTPGASIFSFGTPFSGSNAAWHITRPASSSWHHLVVTYDSSSTSNNPVMYLDGVSQTVTKDTSPVGTVTTLSTHWYIGNRADATRNFDGAISEFSVWNGVILNQNEVNSLYRGISPLVVHNGPNLYLPLYGQLAGEQDWSINHVIQTITGTTFFRHSPVQPYPLIKYAQ